MNLAALQSELQARGYDYLATSRLTQFLNDAYHEINEAEDWPFLETMTSGTAPLTISDLRDVVYVINTVSLAKLHSIDLRTATDRDPNFSTAGAPNTTGTATYWWLDGLTTLRTWPADTTDTLAVRYIKVPADLSAGTDTPVIPARYHSSIVDVAQAIASYRDESDVADEQAIRAEVQVAVQRMSGSLLARELDNPQYVVPVVSENC